MLWKINDFKDLDFIFTKEKKHYVYRNYEFVHNIAFYRLTIQHK